MNIILIAVFGVLAVILGFSKPVLADSAREANTDSNEYTLSGDSLNGIGTVTSEDHFTKFFPNEVAPKQKVSRFNQSLSLSEGDVSLEPAKELSVENKGTNVYFNDGLKVLFDLRSE